MWSDSQSVVNFLSVIQIQSMVTMHNYKGVVNAALILNCNLLRTEIIILFLLNSCVASSITYRLKLLYGSLLVR